METNTFGLSLIAMMAAERHGRFLADAQHERRLGQVARATGWKTAAARFARAVRVRDVTRAARLESWSARRWLQQWSLVGES